MASKAPADNKHLEGLIAAPEIYVDGYQGVSITPGGVAKINFYTTAFDPDTEKTSKVAALKLVASMQTLSAIHNALGQLFEKLEKDGLLQRAEKKSNV